MAAHSPFIDYLQSLDAMMIPYGDGVQIVGMCDAVELEYAAIRKGAALFDCSHRGLLRLTGKDRLDFLHRLTTQDCRSMQPGHVRRAFILNSKGRIMADMLVVHRDDCTLIDTDVHQVATVAQELDKLLFGEDVRVENLGSTHHRVSLHGPTSSDVYAWWRARNSDSLDYPYEEVGVPAVHIWTQEGSLKAFAERAHDLLNTFKLRFVGWHAVNIARIEAGRVMFNVDFGPDNLPHEAGPDALAEAVRFDKGCYRGQEIVARMQSRGHPARLLVGFRVTGDALPIAGVPLRGGPTSESEPVGAVTSSTLSPMLGNVPVGFAMVKWDYREHGSRLYAPAEGKNVEVHVHPPRFFPQQG